MPIVAGAVGVPVERYHARRRGGVGAVVEQQFQRFGVARIDAEVHAFDIGNGAERERAGGRSVGSFGSAPDHRAILSRTAVRAT